MEHYFNVTIRPDPDFTHNTVLNAVFYRLHCELVENKQLTVGVSFPEYCVSPRTLGKVLRLHGTQVALETLNSTDWLKGFCDYTTCTDIQAIPADCQYIAVRRVQSKSSPERLARRYARRKDIDESEALLLYKEAEPKHLKYPFLSLASQSTGQRFKLFVRQDKHVTEKKDGGFNRYGISATATLPWF